MPVSLPHEHGDHFNFVNDFLGRTYRLTQAKEPWEEKTSKVITFLKGKISFIGWFYWCYHLKVKHDLHIEPVGFLLTIQKLGIWFLLQILLHYLPNRFVINVNHYL